MSKSYDNFIALSDSAEVIKKKTQAMFTDPKRVRKTDAGHPESCQVHRYYEVFVSEMKEEVAGWCRVAKTGCAECKKILGERLAGLLEPVLERRRHYLSRKTVLREILEAGRHKALLAAEATMKEVKVKIGIVY